MPIVGKEHKDPKKIILVDRNHQKYPSGLKSSKNAPSGPKASKHPSVDQKSS